MKPLAIIFAAMLSAVSSFAADTQVVPTMPDEVTLTSGRVLRNVEVVRWESNRVVLKSAAGIDPVPFSLIAEPLRSQLESIRQASLSALAAPATVAKPQAREISGQVFYNSGQSSRTSQFAGIEVSAYQAEKFRSYEQGRNLPIGHDGLLGSILALGIGDSRPNLDALKTYMSDEYKSWDGLPPALAKTTTDLDGRFIIRMQSDEKPIVLFARHKSNVSSSHGGVRFFAFAWVAEVGHSQSVILGNTQIQAGMAKALDVFFKPSGE